MAIDFTNTNPQEGDTEDPGNGVTYVYTDGVWTATGSAAGGGGGNGGVLQGNHGVPLPYVQCTGTTHLYFNNFTNFKKVVAGTTQYLVPSAASSTLEELVSSVELKAEASALGPPSLKITGLKGNGNGQITFSLNIVGNLAANPTNWGTIDLSECSAPRVHLVHPKVLNQQPSVAKLVMPGALVMDGTTATTIFESGGMSIGTLDCTYMDVDPRVLNGKFNAMAWDFANCNIDAAGIESFMVRLNDTMVQTGATPRSSQPGNINFIGNTARASWTAACESAASNLESLGFAISFS